MKKLTQLLLAACLLSGLISACVGVETPAPGLDAPETAADGAAPTATTAPEPEENLAEPAVVRPMAEGEPWRVLWTVSGYLIVDGAQADEETAQVRLFAPLDMTEDRIYFDGRVCEGVQFSEQRTSAADYLAETWGLAPGDLGLEAADSFRVIRSNCPLFGFAEYLRLDDLRLVVPFEGALFFFAPSVN